MLLLILTSLVFGAALLTSFWSLCNALVMAVAKRDTKGHIYGNSIVAAVLWGAFYCLTH